MRRLAIAVLVLASCSSPSGGPSRPDGCQPAPAAALEAIATGLEGGTSLASSSMIRDPERSNVYLIAAEIDGPGVEGAGEVGVWATNDPRDPVTIYAVDGYAGEFSDWATLPDATASEWTLARRCLG